MFVGSFPFIAGDYKIDSGSPDFFILAGNYKIDSGSPGLFFFHPETIESAVDRRIFSFLCGYYKIGNGSPDKNLKEFPLTS